MKPEQQKALREPFPKSAIGKLPKGGTTLDYVGHAAVTSRLLEVDPEWTWEPLAFDEVGLPRYDAKGGLWIRLTVGGVSRLGYGDGPDPKQRIGDAIRNAAMRFGVALDLWAKEDIFDTIAHDERQARSGGGAAGEGAPPPVFSKPLNEPNGAPSDAQLKALGALLRGQSREQALAVVSSIVGRDVTSRAELTKAEASAVIDALKAAS